MMDGWPKFFYSAECQDGKKFFDPEDVPDGWVTGPHLIRRDPIVKQTPLPNWDEDDEAEDPVEDQMNADAAPEKKPPGRPRKLKG